MWRMRLLYVPRTPRLRSVRDRATLLHNEKRAREKKRIKKKQEEKRRKKRSGGIGAAAARTSVTWPRLIIMLSSRLAMAPARLRFHRVKRVPPYRAAVSLNFFAKHSTYHLG